MLRFLHFCFFISLHSLAFAQGTLLFCDRVDGAGNANNSFESLILEPEGQTIQLLYRSNTGTLGTDQVKLEIAVLNNHSFKKTDEQTMMADPTKEILAIPYHIKSAGDYRFRLINHEGVLLAEEILSVSSEMSEPETIIESSMTSSDASGTHNAMLTFSNGGPEEVNTEFSFRSTKGKIKLILEPFNEQEPIRILDIWQSENGQYKLFVKSVQATFIKENEAGIFELSFPAMKNFKVDVHTLDNILITSGFVSFN